MTVGQYYFSLIFYAPSELPSATLFPLSRKKLRKFSQMYFCQRNCRVSHQAQNNLSTLDRKVTDKQIKPENASEKYWASSVRPIQYLVNGFYTMNKSKKQINLIYQKILSLQMIQCLHYFRKITDFMVYFTIIGLVYKLRQTY